MRTVLDDQPTLNTTSGDEDDLEHVVCGYCWPAYVPGRMIKALCGATTPDTDIEVLDPELLVECVLCNALDKCPACGTSFI